MNSLGMDITAHIAIERIDLGYLSVEIYDLQVFYKTLFVSNI